MKLKWSEQSWMCRGVSSRAWWGAAARKALSLRVWYLGLSVPQKSKVGRLPANGRLHGDLEHFCATPGSPGEHRGKRGANCSMNVGWTKSAAYVRRAVGCEGAGVGREGVKHLQQQKKKVWRAYPCEGGPRPDHQGPGREEQHRCCYGEKHGGGCRTLTSPVKSWQNVFSLSVSFNLKHQWRRRPLDSGKFQDRSWKEETVESC